MTAIILAGGLGTRLQKIIKNVPKPMAIIDGRPFLELLIHHLLKWNIKKILLSTGHKGNLIKSYFGDGTKWNADIIYSEEDELLGTAGAIKKASGFIDEDPFIAMNGDSFLDLNYDSLISYHENKKAAATLALACVDDISRYGRVETDKNGKVKSFDEKGGSGQGFINGGIYIFNHDIINAFPPGTASLEKEVLPKLVKKGLYGMKTNGFFIDIGIPEDYQSLCDNHERLTGPLLH